MEEEKEEKEKKEEENSHYFLIFYWNPKDKRVFVPKRYGFGWTINFGNPWSVLSLITIMVVIELLIKLV